MRAGWVARGESMPFSPKQYAIGQSLRVTLKEFRPAECGGEAPHTHRGGTCGRHHCCAGKTNVAIAGELYLGEATVKMRITRTFAKHGVTNRVQLTIFAYEAALETP